MSTEWEYSTCLGLHQYYSAFIWKRQKKLLAPCHFKPPSILTHMKTHITWQLEYTGHACAGVKRICSCDISSPEASPNSCSQRQQGQLVIDYPCCALHRYLRLLLVVFFHVIGAWRISKGSVVTKQSQSASHCVSQTQTWPSLNGWYP